MINVNKIKSEETDLLIFYCRIGSDIIKNKKRNIMSAHALLLGEAELEDNFEFSSMQNALTDDFVGHGEAAIAEPQLHSLRTPSDIAKGVTERFCQTKNYCSTIVESEPLLLRASVNIQYGMKHTNLTGMEALYQILREALEINGEGGWSKPPLDTKEQMALIAEM